MVYDGWEARERVAMAAAALARTSRRAATRQRQNERRARTSDGGARGVVRSSVRMCVRARQACVSACVRLNGEGQPALARRRVNNRFSRSSAFFVLHTGRDDSCTIPP